MKISVLLFGIARDIVGDRQVEVDIQDESDVKGLLEFLKDKYPKIRELRSLYVAVNSEYAKDHYVLKEQDEIAIIPPVSGG